MAPPKRFKIKVPDSELEFLQNKLESTRLPDQPSGYTLKQGVPVPEMERVLEYWRSTFLPNWRQHEEELNKLPMYSTPITIENFGDLNIHFVHQRSPVKGAIPLLFIHGWPGSFFEAVKLLPLLKDGGSAYPAFHLVVPSLPNFGFSDGVSKVCRYSQFSVYQLIRTIERLQFTTLWRSLS
jgi:pimeloyl-ACP methyl ester carboxylesterase